MITIAANDYLSAVSKRLFGRKLDQVSEGGFFPPQK
jgi:hypothetical protein